LAIICVRDRKFGGLKDELVMGVAVVFEGLYI